VCCRCGDSRDWNYSVKLDLTVQKLLCGIRAGFENMREKKGLQRKRAQDQVQCAGFHIRQDLSRRLNVDTGRSTFVDPST